MLYAMSERQAVSNPVPIHPLSVLVKHRGFWDPEFWSHREAIKFAGCLQDKQNFEICQHYNAFNDSKEKCISYNS